MSVRHREHRDDFSGGYNSRDGDILLEPNESPGMVNVVVGRRGMVKTRPGTELARSEPVSDPLVPGENNPPVTSIYEFVNQAGHAHFLAFAGDSLKRADGDGWELIQDGFTENSYFEFINHQIEDRALFVNGLDGYWETDGQTAQQVEPYVTEYGGTVGTDGTSVTRISGDEFQDNWAGRPIIIDDTSYEIDTITDGDNLVLTESAGTQSEVDYVYYTREATEVGDSVIPTNPRFIVQHNYTVWLANVAGFPDRLYYNLHDLNGNILYNYFTTWSWLRATNLKGEPITALKVFRDTLFVFTRTTIRAIIETDPFIIDTETYTPPMYEIRQITDTVGTVSQRSIHEVGGNLIFLGPDGVYVFNGTSAPLKVSQRVEPTFKTARSEFWAQACGASHDNKYFISFATTVGGDDIV